MQFHTGEHPNIHPIPRSPLLDKARQFSEMLKADNDRITTFLANGGNPEEVRCDLLDDENDEEQVIQMTLVRGLFEAKIDEPEIPDDFEIPESEFRKATREPQPEE